MSRFSALFATFLLCLQPALTFAAKPVRTAPATAFTTNYQQFDANRIRNWFSNVGEITTSSVTGFSGLEWPDGTGLTAVFKSGLWIAGKVNGEIRTALSEYASEFQPGKILPDGTADGPTLAKYKIYTINRGDVTSDDYLNWPAADGAPVDSDGKPLLLGDQTHWYVCNDLSAETHSHLMNTTPIGLEAQFTIFGADHYQGIQDVMFVKILLINKGSNPLDSAYVGIWSDPDLGSANDDYLGCDTINQLVYCYNGDNYDYGYGGGYMSKIPTVGFQLIQGPVVPAPGKTACKLGQIIPDSRNLSMTAFNSFIGASHNWPDPENAIEAYSCLKGLNSMGVPFTDPTCGCASSFLYPGDPVTQTGWLDIYPSDRRGLFSSGPFTFAPGDTQEVILAVVMGESSDRLGGIVTLRKMAPWINYLYENNFQNLRLPFNLVHSENPYNESADNYLYLQIESDDNHSVDLTNSYVYYRADSLGDFTAVPLQYDQDNQYHGLITLDGNEHLLEYYFSVKEDNEGQSFNLPMAGPTVFYSVLTGQDQTSPTVSANVDYSFQSVLFSGERTFSNDLAIIDRFAPDSIFVEYRINDGEWISIQPEKCDLTSTTFRTDGSYSGDYEIETRIAWQDLNFGDQIEYRYVVFDSSDNHNRGQSSSGFIRIIHQKSWGTTTEFYSEFHYDWEIDGWYVIWGGSSKYPDWSHCDSAKYYRNYLENTMTYQYSIPLNQYQNFSVVYEEAVQVTANDTCFVEINPDGQGWQTLYYHTNNIPSSISLKKVVLPLDSFSSASDIRFRFRFKSTEHIGDMRGWYINNITFYADTLALGNYTTMTIQDFSIIDPVHPTTYANWDLDGWQFKNVMTNRTIQGISADSSSNYSDNLNTTLTYNQPVDFSGYFLAYLRLYGLHWINAGDTGFVELGSPRGKWTPIKFFTGDTNTTQPTELWYEDIAIPVAYLSDSYYFRFRFQSDASSENNQYGWWLYKVLLTTAERVSVDPETSILPTTYTLFQNYPNPFNPTTTIRYQLPEQTLVEITAYNLLGQQVKRLVKENKSAGTYSVVWNAGNLPSGIYLIRMTAGDFYKVQKCILLK